MTLRALACAVALLGVVTLSACTASSSPTGPTASAQPAASAPGTPTSPGTVVPSTAAPDTGAPTRSAPTTSRAPSTSAPATSAPVTSPPTTTSAPPPVPARSSCTELTIRVLLGSGAPGFEFAALQFVNDGSKACTLVGVPTVTLLRHGKQTGTLSQPSKDRARFTTYHLAPGAVAESKLKDFSTCNAPLSQTIRVVAPGSSISTTRPGELRACRLVVYPLGAPE